MTDFVYVCFIRKNGLNNIRGEIAGKPRVSFPPSNKNLIVCKIDSSLITADITRHRSAMLKLSKLQKPNTVKVITDENGDNHAITVYDYFDQEGRSSEEDCPAITLDDVELGEVSNG